MCMCASLYDSVYVCLCDSVYVCFYDSLYVCLCDSVCVYIFSGGRRTPAIVKGSWQRWCNLILWSNSSFNLRSIINIVLQGPKRLQPPQQTNPLLPTSKEHRRKTKDFDIYQNPI